MNGPQLIDVDLGDITISRFHSRVEVDASKPDEAIAILAEDIRTNGLISPPCVRRRTDGKYELIAGFRRTEACRLIGLEKIQVKVYHEISDDKAMNMHISENLQRENLTPFEMALFLKNAQNKFGYSCRQLADITGLSKSDIADKIKIFSLPEHIIDCVKWGQIGCSHAVFIARLTSSPKLGTYAVMDNIVRKIKKYKLSRSEVRDLVKVVEDGIPDLISDKAREQLWDSPYFTAAHARLCMETINHITGSIPNNDQKLTKDQRDQIWKQIIARRLRVDEALEYIKSQGRRAYRNNRNPIQGFLYETNEVDEALESLENASNVFTYFVNSIPTKLITDMSTFQKNKYKMVSRQLRGYLKDFDDIFKKYHNTEPSH